MKLIVGLGNPGDKYTATRHNAGFWFVERLAAESRTVLRNDGKFQALVGRHEASGAWLVLPQTFMNASGRPVQMMASFFKIEPADVLVIHDELDLPPGTARLKQGGGVAGHNGLKDISARLGSHDYWRLRLGIGRPPERGATVEFVLHKPAQDERAALDDAIGRGLEVLPLVLAGDTQGAMLKLHTTEPAPKAEPETPAARSAPARASRIEQAGSAGSAPIRSPDTAPGAARASIIEKFGRAVEAGTAGPAPAAGPAEKPGAIEPAQAPAPGHDAHAKTPARAEKKSALNSLLNRILPGTGTVRKK